MIIIDYFATSFLNQLFGLGLKENHHYNFPFPTLDLSENQTKPGI